MGSLFKRSILGARRSLLQGKTINWPEESLGPPAEGHFEGGCYPAAIGEVFNSRYTILRKLGWQPQFNVWLARDNRENKYVSMKFLSAAFTAAQGHDLDQLGVLEHIRIIAQESTHPGRNHVPTLLDHFRQPSEYGEHSVFVSHPFGDSLSAVGRAMNGSVHPDWLVKSVARQTLSALDFLHEECGVVQTDIKPNSIHFTINDADIEPVLQADTPQPDEYGSILSTPIPPSSLSQVKIIDFDTASIIGCSSLTAIQPVALRSPEVLLGLPWDTKADIWNLGCIISEMLLRGNWLFQPTSSGSYTAEQSHLVQMETMFGETFDQAYFKDGTRYDYFFRKDGRLRVPGRVQTMEEILQVYQVFDEKEELELCISFLGSMLRLNPLDRPTAQKLLEHPWIKEADP